MKFNANKESFAQSLQKVVGALPAKTTIPVLNNILLRIEGDKAFFTGTDLEISITTSCPVEVLEEGTIAVPGRRFFDIIRELPDLPISLESDPMNHLQLKNDKGVYKFIGESEDEFPHIEVEEADFEFVLPAETFNRMVEKTIYAVSTDELRVTLTGVYLQILPNELRMVATDGHRLAKISYKRFQGGESTISVILPTKALNLVTKNISPETDLKALISENHVIFTFDETKIYSKVINGQYPNYERVIPIDNNIEMHVNREMLMAAVRRVSIFSNPYTHQIRFSISPSSLVVQAEDVEMGGEAQEAIPADYSGEPMEIGYNAAYILDILRHIDSENVVFRLKNPETAAIIEPSEQQENEDLMKLLMPIRLNDAV
ncbi:MAG: DNA polymerase III subunit beta [candidate division KSB1 bacterium]|nr:DNA polymerase III subunit beta [candidate division KSB1 bacterium]MDQ7065503.1 DNA polymerase III subunit beta [candidate division KSB1 bacterium]